MFTAFNKLRAGNQAEQKTRTGSLQIITPGIIRANFVS